MVAQTNLQLYNQLRGQGRRLDELVAVHRAYELLTRLYAGHYQADGKPFVAHGVGVASILAALGQPGEIIAVGLLHNVYGNADFGDGRRSGVTARRRRLVREAVGPEVEELLIRFRALRITPANVAELRRSLPERDAVERSLLLVDVADQLEKHVDLGVLYFGQDDWLVDMRDRLSDQLVAIAGELGHPELGRWLREAFARSAAEAAAVPPELRASHGRRYLELIVPRSCRRRGWIALLDVARGTAWRLRPRTRMRALARRRGTAVVRA